MHRLHTIPKSLHSCETELPFDGCYDCSMPLDESESGYVIQKVISKDETIMEIAICQHCHEKLQSSYSKESREKIWDFFLDNSEIDQRAQKYKPIPVGLIDPWINHCVTCGTARASASEYAIAAHCYKGNLVYGETPMMICLKCMDAIVGLLSDESRKTYDDWVDRCLPMAPEITVNNKKVRVLV